MISKKERIVEFGKHVRRPAEGASSGREITTSRDDQTSPKAMLNVARQVNGDIGARGEGESNQRTLWQSVS